MNQALSITLHRIIGLLVITLFQNIQERTKALVFVFVFVLVDKQAMCYCLLRGQKKEIQTWWL